MAVQNRHLGKLGDNTFVRAVRVGLVNIIPILMVGSFALILRSFPLHIYQNFINTFLSGFLYNVFSIVYNATFGILSVYMAFSLGYAVVKESGKKCLNPMGAPISAVIAFLISVGYKTDSFSPNSLSAVGMFTAIVCGLTAANMYVDLSRIFKFKAIFSDGSDSKFSNAVVAIPHITFVSVVFALINALIALIPDVDNFWSLTSSVFSSIFQSLGNNFLGAFIYIFLSSILWFFGVHGSDVLESVNLQIFEPALSENAQAVAAGGVAPHIFTKTFFDTFVLIGGCGTLLSLLIALFLFSKRKCNRSVAKMAAFPMLFNINEIMVFGLPIIYNPIMFIPFILAPIASFLIATVATVTGLIPITMVDVEWTTPIFLGGYMATGSISGAILQLVNLSVGVLIYMPFVRLYDLEKEKMANENIHNVVKMLKKAENERLNITLVEDESIGDIARQLVNDLENDIKKSKLEMFYQPQFHKNGKIIGFEALLRWKHPAFGYIYPPLIIKLAQESGMLEKLEKQIFLKVKSDMERLNVPITVSINVTPQFFIDNKFIDFVLEQFPNAMAGKSSVCIEVTEQSELITDEQVSKTFKILHENGFKLAIDDFSMGFTSLKYLSDNHFDVVKLDGTLVKGINNPRNKDIIKSIVYLSQSLGFNVLAEYVETQEQRDVLAQIGCYIYQGYLYSKAINVEELERFIIKNK